jgi:hypothetical protein
VPILLASVGTGALALDALHLQEDPPMRAVLLFPILALGLSCSSVAQAAPETVEITTCGQAVPRRAIGFLTDHLDCTGFTGAPGAVMVSRSATLDLRGFTITGGRFNVLCGELRPDRFGVDRLHIDGKCKVVGGAGTVIGAEAHGVTANTMTVTNLSILGAGQEGISARRNATLSDVVIDGSTDTGARIDHVAKITASSITGSGESGISARKVILIDSTVTGSGLGPECDPPARCADLVTVKRPRLENSTCGTSRSPDFPFHWGVCSDDF